MTETKHTLEQVLAAIDKGCTRTGAAKVLGCTPETVYNYSKRWKSVYDALHNKRRELVDLAEMGLRSAVLRGEPWAVTFALRTLGKEEGYTERQEITGANGNAIQLQVVEQIVSRRQSGDDPTAPSPG